MPDLENKQNRAGPWQSAGETAENSQGKPPKHSCFPATFSALRFKYVNQISFKPGFGAYQSLVQKIGVPFSMIFKDHSAVSRV